MDDFRDTELMPKAPTPDELKRTLRRQRVSWVLYALVAMAVFAAVMASTGFWF